MKIIYVANVRMPTEKAHGIQIMKMCENFALSGAEVELVLPRRINSEFVKTDPFAYYNIERQFKLRKLWSLDPRFLLKLKSGLYIKFQSLCFLASLFFYLIFIPKKGTIIYTRDEYLLPFLQLFSLPTFWEGHAIPKNIDKYIKFMNHCVGLGVLTTQIKKELIKGNIPADKILVLPDAVDLKIFDINISQEQARVNFNLPREKIIVGYTGTFKTKGMDKGIADIIKSLKYSKNFSNILFVAVGGSREEIEYYKNITIEEKVDNKILLLAKVPQNELAIYQKAFDILLMPFPFNQHYAYFMSPLKMFEYMAAGRPIIASDLLSIKEVLNENNCLFCRPDDPKDLAEKIDLLIADHELADKIKNNAHQDAKKYTWEKRANIVMDIINKN